MRILIVSPELPYPPAWGFAIRVSRVLALLSRNHTVSLLSYARDGDDDKVRALAATCHSVHTVREPADSSMAKRVGQLKSMLSSASYHGSYLFTDEMQRKLDELTSKEQFDVIQVETSQMATFRFDPRAALAIVEHDIVYELLGRMATSERSVLRRAYNSAEARKFKREEIERWKQASACIVTSSREVPIVRAAGISVPVLVAPNGVDVEYFSPSQQDVEPDTLVMTGLMRYRPNIDAAAFFVSEVFPQILAARPNARIFIVGGDPPEEVTKLASDRVIVTGGVPDVRPYVHRAAVVVVPLRMGGGTRLKVLEGLSMKKAMVSTSIGCEGIDVEDQKHLLIRDDADSFAKGVLQLLDNPATGAALASEGYQLVGRQYRWEMVVEKLERLYTQLVAERAAQRSK
ncbi:MAG: glycosyltransferase [Vicinamibacterales bacterium]